MHDLPAVASRAVSENHLREIFGLGCGIRRLFARGHETTEGDQPRLNIQKTLPHELSAGRLLQELVFLALGSSCEQSVAALDEERRADRSVEVECLPELCFALGGLRQSISRSPPSRVHRISARRAYLRVVDQHERET